MRGIRWTAMLVMLVASAALLQTRPVSADWEWSYDDPIVEIAGHTVQINVGVQGDPAVIRENIDKAITTIYVPKGVTVKKISTTKVFFKEKVEIEHTDASWTPGQPVNVKVVVTFEAETKMPAQTVITSAGVMLGTVIGSTNDALTTRFTLK